MNPRAAINDLHPFQGCPFSHLGYFSKQKLISYINIKIRWRRYLQRRGWDSNPRALADKRFSRPPRYDHFDISPCLVVYRCSLTAKVILPKNLFSVNYFFTIFFNFFQVPFFLHFQPLFNAFFQRAENFPQSEYPPA